MDNTTARLSHAGPDATEWKLTGHPEGATRIRLNHDAATRRTTAILYDDTRRMARHAGAWPEGEPDAAILARLGIRIDTAPDMRIETTIAWQSDQDPDCIDAGGTTWQPLRVLRRQGGIDHSQAIGIRDAANLHPQAIRREGDGHVHWDIPMANVQEARQWLDAAGAGQPLPALPPDVPVILSITLGPWNR